MASPRVERLVTSAPEDHEIDAPAPKRSGKPAKPSASEEEMIGWGVCSLFGAIAFATGHPHWVRTPDQAAPITEPLARMLARMEPAKKAKLMEAIDPANLLIGIATVAGPSVREEMDRLQGRRSPGLAGRGVPGGPTPAPRAATAQPTGAAPDPGKVDDHTGTFVGVH